ncbi:MAG: AEC family transporter [Rickettsiaceae bacterium]|nr:AEC family transporter [Rickettsiaceae bacterium]
MALFSLIFFKIISILLSIILGFCAGRLAKIGSKDIANLLFYFIAPIVFFSIPANTTLSLASLSLAALTFFISSSIAIFGFYFFRRYFQDNTLNMVAYSSGNANTGYFMLPIATALFDDYTLSMYMMAVVGISIYDCSLGYYICMRSFSSTKESIAKVVRMPNLNAFALGCLCSFAGIQLPDFLDDFIYNMRGAYSILGMVVVGIGVSNITSFYVDKKFTISLCISKFIFYPLVINCFIILDKLFFNFFDQSVYYALQLIATAPIAANTIVMANLLNFSQEKVATSLLISMLIALIYIPLTCVLLFENIGHLSLA